MANVWDAMRKHEAEQARRKAEAPDAPADASPAAAAEPGADADAPAVEAAPPTRPKRTRVAIPPGPTVNANGKYAEVLRAYHEPGSDRAEEYRSLRTSLLANATHDRVCCVVTSAEPEEGKTVTCLNLAMVMAELVDRRTIVVDLDLRKKDRMAGLLSAAPSPGMSDMLRGEQRFADCRQPTAYPNLSFLPAGVMSSARVGELVGRPELEDIVTELRREYDFVIIDTPPINRFSDASVIGRTAGEALLVVRMNRTRRESVNKAIRLLHAGNVPISGMVLTHQKFYIPKYIYRYS